MTFISHVLFSGDKNEPEQVTGINDVHYRCVASAVHARIRSKKKGGGKNIAIYPLSLLFFLCTIFCAIDTAQTLFIVSADLSILLLV